MYLKLGYCVIHISSSSSIFVKNIQMRQRFGNAFSVIFCLRAKDMHGNQCCFLELSLGRLPKILVDVLAL